MIKNYSASFEWPIRTSLLQQRLLIIAHALAIVAILIGSVASLYKIALVLTIVMSGIIYWRAYGQCGVNLMLRYTDAFGWEVSVNNEYRPIRILKSTVVNRWVIVLHYRLDDKDRHRAIFNDALSKQDFRQLIVQLKIAGLAGP